MFAKVSETEVVDYPVNPVADFPHMSFPPNWSGGIIGNHQYVIVQRTLPPDSGMGKIVTEGTPVLEDGVWKQSWNISYKPLEEHKKEIKEVLADLRYRKEIAGVTVSGIQFATDRESQTKYIAIAVDLSQADPNNYSIKWKDMNGNFHTLNGFEMFAAINAVRTHIQDCYNKEAEYIALIDAAQTSESLAAIDITENWP